MDSSKSLKDYGEFEEVWSWIEKVCIVRIKPVWAIQWDLYQKGHKIKTTQGDISCWAYIYPWIFCFHRRQQWWLHTGAPFLKILSFTLALAFGGGVTTAAASIIPRRHREHSRTLSSHVSTWAGTGLTRTDLTSLGKKACFAQPR